MQLGITWCGDDLWLGPRPYIQIQNGPNNTVHRYGDSSEHEFEGNIDPDYLNAAVCRS